MKGMRNLLILGNGFDRAINLKTSYGDFYEWLENGNFFRVNLKIF